jgi:tRNA threonylcarbamoyladenosine biosynthesis protein TsaE
MSDTSEDGFLARGEEGTQAAGSNLARTLAPGDLVLLTGDVGTGKSTLVRAALRELGVSGAIPSPTFTIGRIYDQPGQRIPAAHLDLYRIGELDQEDPGLLAGYFGPDRVTFVEWPGGGAVALSEMANRVIEVNIDDTSRETRRITIRPRDIRVYR